MNSEPPPRRWHRRSLRLRVLLAMLVWVALGMGGIGYSALQLYTRHVEQQFHDELNVHVRELAGLVRITSDGHAAMERPLSDPRYLEPLSGFYWQVRLDRGEVLRSPSLTRGSLDFGVADADAIRHRLRPGPTGPTVTYGFARPAGTGDRRVHYVIATDQRLLDAVVDRFQRELLTWLGLVGMAMLVTGYALIRFGLAPLDRLRLATARLRSGRDMRLRGSFPSEIAPLADDLNAFIDHTTSMAGHARIEAGNLAHALRTPLAVVTDEAERLASQAATAASGAVLLEQARRMAQQIEYQLARARTVAPAGMPGTASDITSALAPVITAMRRLYPDVAITLDDSFGPGSTLPIDQIDLTELLSILIDNACKWASTTVTVEIAAGQAGPMIRIRDDGPGLEPGQIAKAFEIGTRFDPSRPGSGLGLAIARDIASWYRLELRLERDAGGTGLVATIAA